MNGCLGLGHTTTIDKPTKIEELCNKNVIAINNTCSSLVALTKNNKLYSWGLKTYGQIGNGNNNDCLKPVIIKALMDKQVIDIKCGSHHCLALTLNGEVFEWGWSVSGDNTVPIKVIGFEMYKVNSISCGAYHALVLTDYGDVFSWGYNNDGQCGTFNFVSQRKPFKINTMNEKINKICCGHNHSLLLSENGDIFAFGDNNFGQLGNGSKFNNNTPLKIDISTKFVDILTQNKNEYNISIGLSNDGFCYV